MKRAARSRREFLRLLAAGSAAALAAPAVALAADPPKPAPAGRRPRSVDPAARPARPEEIEKQKKSMAESVKRIRDYPLPPGSAPAFVFRPLAAARARKLPR